jgi:hypothetical protein
MHLPGSRIRMNGIRKVANPEGGRLDLKPDQWLWVTPIYYPGEPYPEETWSGRMGKTVEKWSFWTNYDIDGAFIFDAEAVAEVEIPISFELPEAFNNAPFMVTRK